MNNYKCDILGLSEVRWTGSGRIKLASGESMIFRDEMMKYTALMLTCKAARALMEWNPVNGRIITARFYSRFIKTTVIQVYAPTNDYSDEDKDAFYEQLQATWNKAPKHDVKIVMGTSMQKWASQTKVTKSTWEHMAWELGTTMEGD